MITKDMVVSMNYVLRDDHGSILDASKEEPLSYLHGHNNIIPGLEKALDGLKPGDNTKVTVSPEEGYGQANPNMVFQVQVSQFGNRLPEEGDMVQMSSPQGTMVARVVEMNDQDVTLDANHPLCGMTLHFEVEIKDVRAASEEELAHGHTHGPGGHHH